MPACCPSRNLNSQTSLACENVSHFSIYLNPNLNPNPNPNRLRLGLGLRLGSKTQEVSQTRPGPGRALITHMESSLIVLRLRAPSSSRDPFRDPEARRGGTKAGHDFPESRPERTLRLVWPVMALYAISLFNHESPFLCRELCRELCRNRARRSSRQSSRQRQFAGTLKQGFGFQDGSPCLPS